MKEPNLFSKLPFCHYLFFPIAVKIISLNFSIIKRGIHLPRSSAFYRFSPAIIMLLSWGFMNIPSAFAIAEIPAVPLMTVRMTIASVALALCALKFEGRLFPDRRDIPIAMLMGAVGMYGNNSLYLMAITRTSLTNVAICFATVPLMTAVLAAIFLGEKLHFRHIMGIILALFGVLMLLCDGHISSLLHLRVRSGDLIELLGSLCCASMMIMGRKIRYSPPISVTFCCILSACFLCWTSWFFTGGSFASATWRGWLSLLYLSFLASAAAYLCQQLSLKRIGARATGAFINAEVPVSIFSATIFMGERLSTVQVLSTIIIFLGIFANVSDHEDVSNEEASHG